MPRGQKYRKPTKDDVGLVKQLSLLPNIILTGRDLDKVSKATVNIVNELKERVEDWSILWVDARSVNSIQKSYVQILETLMKSRARFSNSWVKALLQYLSWTYEGLWIMVFDGLEAEMATYLQQEKMFPRSCAGTLIISTTDPTSARLLGPAEVIQLPEGDLSHEADMSFEHDRFGKDKQQYDQLRAYLICIMNSSPTPFATSSDYVKDFRRMELYEIQHHLVEANLRRWHRFWYAHLRSDVLRATRAANSRPIREIPEGSASNAPAGLENIPVSQTNTTTAVKQRNEVHYQAETHTIPSLLRSAEGGEYQGRRDRYALPAETMRSGSTITTRGRFPRGKKIMVQGRTMWLCPCCCQVIPPKEAKDFWLWA